MSPELLNIARPLEVPRGVHLVPSEELAPLAGKLDEHFVELVAHLIAEGRDSAALVIVTKSCGAVAHIAARGVVREQLMRCGSVGRTLSQRLAVRAPRGCWFVALLDEDGMQGRLSLATLPGHELEGAAA